MTLVLASGSVTRATLLREAGIGFEAIPASVDEAAIRDRSRADGLGAGDTALVLAEAKAAAVRALRPDALVLGADQMLSLGTSWLEKPVDLAAAADQLRRLAGRRHTLHTAAVLVGPGTIWRHLAEPSLLMRPLDPDEIAAYVATEGPALLGSVGAYRIEGPGRALFAAIDGEDAAIRGLPLLALQDALARLPP